MDAISGLQSQLDQLNNREFGFAKGVLEAAQRGEAEEMRFIEKAGEALATGISSSSTTANKVSDGGFSKILDSATSFIDKVDGAKKSYEKEVVKVATGESENLHQAMILKEESRLMLKLMVEVRNAVVDGWRELLKSGTA